MEMFDYVIFCGLLASLSVSLYVSLKKKKRKRLWVRPWIKRRDDPKNRTLVHLYKELLIDGDVAEFRKTLRMSPETYGKLMNMLRANLTKQHTNFRAPVPAETRLLATLRYLALGDGFLSISQQFRLGLSTTRMIIGETCIIIYKTMQNRYVSTPRSREAWLHEAELFEQKWQFPHCVSAVDGKHIRIAQPPHTGSQFYNYKGYFSVVLLALVNADYRFLYIDIGSEGKASDGGIWQKCTFNHYLSDPSNPLQFPDPDAINSVDINIPYFLVGDDAFRLNNNLMKPFKGTVTRKESIFNYRLSRARRVAENAFGILSCRFRIFHHCIEVLPGFVEDIVLACCALHNFLRVEASGDYMQNMALDFELPDGQIVPGEWRQEAGLDSMRKDSQKNPTNHAKEIRSHLSDYFLTEEGELPWQYRVTLE